jgi:hypothetical protein
MDHASSWEKYCSMEYNLDNNCFTMEAYTVWQSAQNLPQNAGQKSCWELAEMGNAIIEPAPQKVDICIDFSVQDYH